MKTRENTIDIKPFGLIDGEQVELITLSNIKYEFQDKN